YGDVYDKVLYDDQMDMRITHFEQEIGYRFGITQATGIGVFANNINNIYVAPQGMPNTTAIDGSAEPGLSFDGMFSFGYLKTDVEIPVLYCQSWQAPLAVKTPVYRKKKSSSALGKLPGVCTLKIYWAEVFSAFPAGKTR
ncbi:MAG: hypothetical protein LBQ35_07315, partial [Spirochaetaceae bacterium]|nr:hypothetical protein [Spirochaetaceae bacterium]